MTNKLWAPGVVVDSPWLNDVNTGTYDYLTTVAGTANAITAIGPLAWANVAGNNFYLTPTATNTGATTLNINAIGAKNITKYGTTALVAGDLVVGVVAELLYDGTQFQLLNPQATVPTTASIPFSQTTGTVPINRGGTGATTVAGAQAAFAGPVFSANLITTPQNLAQSTPTTILFNNKEFDTGSFYNTATGIFQPTVSGYYQINAALNFFPNGAFTISTAIVLINKNGTEYIRGVQMGATGISGGSMGCVGSGLVFMNGTTDTLNVQAYVTSSGGTPQISTGFGTRFSAAFIRP